MILKSIAETDFVTIPLGFDDGQVKLTDQNIRRILTFSGVPLAFLRCCEGEGNNTAVLYKDGQIFIIPVDAGYFMDCIGEYLDYDMPKHRQTTAGIVEKRSNNAIYLGAGVQYISLKVAAPWVNSRKSSYVHWQEVVEHHWPKERCLITDLGIAIFYTQRPAKVKEKLDEGKKARDGFIDRCGIVRDAWIYCDYCEVRPVCLKFLDK